MGAVAGLTGPAATGRASDAGVSPVVSTEEVAGADVPVPLRRGGHRVASTGDTPVVARQSTSAT